jgi:hypothetical protein
MVYSLFGEVSKQVLAQLAISQLRNAPKLHPPVPPSLPERLAFSSPWIGNVKSVGILARGTLPPAEAGTTETKRPMPVGVDVEVVLA